MLITKMTNYNDCFIYQILHLPTGKVYIGSSCYKYRWNIHKNDKNAKFSKFIRNEGLINFKFNKLHDYPCTSFNEQIQEEQRIMDSINKELLLNTNRAYTSPEQKTTTNERVNKTMD